jgi:ribosome-associated translation inhibitor RaiA
MDIDIRGLTGDGRLRTHIRDRMTTLPARVRTAPLAARVVFADENGPKGGVDIRCSLAARRPSRPPVTVAHMGASPRHAFDEAFAVLERRLARDAERALELRRRPKKYYVSKLLAGRLDGSGARARRAT